MFLSFLYLNMLYHLLLQLLFLLEFYVRILDIKWFSMYLQRKLAKLGISLKHVGLLLNILDL